MVCLGLMVVGGLWLGSLGCLLLHFWWVCLVRMVAWAHAGLQLVLLRLIV